MGSAVMVSPAALAPAPKADAATEQSASNALFAGVGITIAGVITLTAAAGPHNAPAAITGAALVTLGPSVGHYWAHQYITTGLVLRVAGIGVAALGASNAVCFSHCSDQDGAVLLLGLGAALFIGGLVHDISTTRPAVRHYHHSLHPTATIAPLVVEHGAGLSLAGAF